jgi:hypothetical protein
MKLKVIIDIPAGQPDPQFWNVCLGHGGHIPDKGTSKRFLVHAIIPDEAVSDAEYLGSEKAIEMKETRTGRKIVVGGK